MALDLRSLTAIETFEREDQKAEKILENYTDCTKLLNKFFFLIYDDYCKSCIKYENPCCNNNKINTNISVFSPAFELYEEKKKIILKKARNQGRIIDGEKICTYLEDTKGCILSDLKPPFCVKTFCHSSDINKKYNIEYHDARIREALENILLGENDQIFIENFKDYIQSMIKKVEKFKTRNYFSNTYSKRLLYLFR